MWSQLQMLTVAPANGSLAAVPPTDVARLDQQRSQSRLARYAAQTRPLWPAPITIAS